MEDGGNHAGYTRRGPRESLTDEALMLLLDLLDRVGGGAGPGHVMASRSAVAIVR